MTSSLASDPAPPTRRSVLAAARRLAPHVVRTPLLESWSLNKELGGRLLIKAECLQQTGSFKIRGALNRILRLPKRAAMHGVVAYSSGNHGAAVAAAANLRGIEATIVMPASAPATKIENVRRYGADIVFHDWRKDDRAKIAEDIVTRTGAVLVPPYDHPDVIAGQGTVGLEIADQARLLGARPDDILVPCGGGGLSAGIALATAASSSRTRIRTVEPEGFDDTARSLEAKRRIRHNWSKESLCDSLLVDTPGALPFDILNANAASGLIVGDESVLDAMAVAFREFHIVAEPGGAVALAAILSGACPIAGRTVVAVVSGGNVDIRLFQRALQRA